MIVIGLRSTNFVISVKLYGFKEWKINVPFMECVLKVLESN